MTRKNVLKGLIEGNAGASPPAPPRPTRGAIGAVSRSIADLKARAVVELDAAAIDAGGVEDRLDNDTEADASLLRSIQEYGQQVPVLVRPHPQAEGRFQIVYGRRRVLALRDLGLPVKALIRDLDDRELVMAQGQENTARRDLSFIEKVNFARQLRDIGYDRKIICDALSVDKTLMSRMLSVADRIPVDLIRSVGAAPTVGRDRWLALADMMDATETEVDELSSMMTLNAASTRSDDRFQAGWDYLTDLVKKRALASRPEKAPVQRRPLQAPKGPPLGEARFGPTYCTLKLRLSRTDGFESWLIDQMPDLFQQWRDQGPDKPQD